MGKKHSLRILTWAVIVYLLLAFAWWSVLLFMKNREVFEAKKEALRLEMVEQGQWDETSFKYSDEFLSLEQDFRWQRWMIAGEASFFVISLAIGVWMINRGYNQLVSAADQQRNFLLAITHELKSPLASIRLSLETILHRSLSGEKLQSVSRKAMSETERLDHMVNNLLLAAKMEHGFNPSYETIRIDEIIPSLMERMRSKFPDTEFRTRVHPGGMTLQADRMGLTSILFNLMENAVKYSPPNAPVTLDVYKNKAGIVFEVSDEGPGIPGEERKLVFEKFYRIGSEETRKTKGTGLGLYIVKRMVEAQNGQVFIEDNELRGTRFVVKIPVSKEN